VGMHDNPDTPFAVRLPPEGRPAPEQENACGKEDDRAENVLESFCDEQTEQKDDNGDPATADQGRQQIAEKQGLPAGATNQLRFTESSRLFWTVVRLAAGQRQQFTLWLSQGAP